jgi:hypothetical protein
VIIILIRRISLSCQWVAVLAVSLAESRPKSLLAARAMISIPTAIFELDFDNVVPFDSSPPMSSYTSQTRVSCAPNATRYAFVRLDLAN